MKMKARLLGLLMVVFIFTSFAFTSSVLAGSTQVTSDGIKFPDGTIQTTKATETGIPGPEGPQGPIGGFKFYDANDVCLGYVISPGIAFDPDIQASYFISMLVSQPKLSFSDGPEFYTSTDCTGARYTPFQTFTLYKIDDSYYIVDTGATPLNASEIHSSMTTIPFRMCNSSTDTGSGYMFLPLKQVEFPLGNVTLKYPISIR